MKQVAAGNLVVVGGEYEYYHQLSDEELSQRLCDERDRAKAMDEKTFKMTLALTVGLTVLGTTATAMVHAVPLDRVRPFVAVFAWVAILYSLAGGFVALGALRTLPSFGYGTDFLIQAKRDRAVVPEGLATQEMMNIVRHLRNEAAYQCLRNGILCLCAAVLQYGASVAADTLGLDRALARRRQDRPATTDPKVVTTIAPDTAAVANRPTLPLQPPVKEGASEPTR